MTGYTTHSGPSQKFDDGWNRVFGKPAKVKKQTDTAARKKDAKGGKKSKKSRG